ncbi:MAG TPA: hypothetical protein VMA32_00345 [Streptosporangiaceae bacterium]|nr:hypothetical protein [Streptosporangiaceae bacterium]
MELRTRRALTCGAILVTVMAFAGSASAATATDPRYDHNAHWRVVLKTPAGSDHGFIAIAASGPRSAWAIGDIANNSTYLLHWNGKSWRRMTTPSHYAPSGVSGSGPSDVYLIGDLNPPGAPSDGEVLHWNGQAWSLVLRTQAAAILDISPANVWVESESGYLYRWGGASWTRTRYGYAVNDIPGTVAAVGQRAWRTTIGRVGKQRHRLIVQRWTGTAWRAISSPRPEVPGTLYPSIAASSARNVWIEVSNRRGLHNVRLLHWNGKTWTTLFWPSGLASLAQGYLAAVGKASVWLGNGQLLRNRSGWHLSNDGGCGIPVGVPRTNSALCAGVVNITAKGRSYGTISQSGR